MIVKIICCPFNVIDGYLITKEKRHELFGKVAGGSLVHAILKNIKEKIS
jgi:hypothetical protein